MKISHVRLYTLEFTEAELLQIITDLTAYAQEYKLSEGSQKLLDNFRAQDRHYPEG